MADRQLTFDDVVAGRARYDGIARAEAHAPADWRQAAHDALRWCRNHYATFTADEVLARLEVVGAPATHNLSALGPVFLAASRAGLIAKTGTLRPTRLARRHRDLTVWASTSPP